MIRHNIIGEVFWGRGVFSGSKRGMFVGCGEFLGGGGGDVLRLLNRSLIQLLMNMLSVGFLLLKGK